MENILFESFRRVNAEFNNEYVLVVPRFSSFFGHYEDSHAKEDQLANIITSYLEYMRVMEVIVKHNNFHHVNSMTDMVGNKEILFDTYLNEYFNRSLLSTFIILKKDKVGTPDSFSIEEYEAFIKELSASGKAKEYIKKSFEDSFAFLEKWTRLLKSNIHQEYTDKVNSSKGFLYNSETTKKILVQLLVANEYCGHIDWAISLPKEHTFKFIANIAKIKLDQVVSDLSQENFFSTMFSDRKRTSYYSLKDFLNSNFSPVFVDAISHKNPKEYIINQILEDVPQSQIDEQLFSYLNKDLSAIALGMNNQENFKVLIHGIAGAGKTEFSKVIAKAVNKPMYRMKMNDLVSESGSKSVHQKIANLLNIANLFKDNEFILLVDECEEIFENDTKFKEQINYILETLRVPCIFIANEIKQFHTAYLRRFQYHINMDICDYEQKKKIVRKYLPDSPEEVVSFIADNSVTNADITDNINFFSVTNDLDFLRQKIENKQITQDMIQLNQVEKSLYNFVTPENNRFDFDSIIGYKEEKENLLNIKHYLDNKKQYEALKIKMPHGSILYGYPGTGKTSMIKALAKKANMPMIMVATGMMENDANGALNIKKIFNVAKKNMPCIILLDEFEKMALDRKLEMYNGTSQSLMNQLLMEMDEIYQKNHDIFVYATCNTIDYIDPAISRSGRLEQMVEIGLPNAKMREQMFKKLLPKEVQVKGLKQVIQNTTGFSFVDIESVVNNYKITLLKDNGKHSRQYLLMKEIHNFMLGKTSSGKLLKEEKELVAYHESGHAFLAYLFDKAVGNISIIPKSNYLGVTLMLKDETKYIKTKEDVEHELMILMGGRASEKVFLEKETTGSSDDFNRATKLAMNHLNVLASEHLGLLYADMNEYNDKYSETYKIKVENTVNKILSDLFEKTKQILKDSKEEIESMVTALMKKEEMVQHEMEGLLHATMSAKNVTKMSKLSIK